MSDTLQPWDKLPDETFKAHRAFKLYLDMGDSRSYVRTCSELKLSRNMAQRWGAQFRWVERAAAWDTHIARIKQEAKEKVARVRAEKWAERQIEAADKAWEEAESLRAWAVSALSTAKMKGTIGMIAKIFMAAGTTRERSIVLALQALSEDDGFDPMSASPDQLRAYLAKRGVKPASQEV